MKTLKTIIIPSIVATFSFFVFLLIRNVGQTGMPIGKIILGSIFVGLLVWFFALLGRWTRPEKFEKHRNENKS